MQQLGLILEARARVCGDAQKLISDIRELTTGSSGSFEDALALLDAVRRTAYEHLNQLQHERLILAAADWLVDKGFAESGTNWEWNPRQSGGATEPDLRGVSGLGVVCAEVTSSARPEGTIATRMARTLEKLARMNGRKFYFVCTPEMAKRATTKCFKSGLDIEVVQLG